MTQEQTENRTEKAAGEGPQPQGPHEEFTADQQLDLNDQTPEQASEEASYKEKFYYAAAELENSKKRHQREKEQMAKYATETLLQSLLEVIDNFERTLTAISVTEDSPAVKNIKIGIEMVHKQFLSILEQQGVKQLSSLGAPFNPNHHEALSFEESTEVPHMHVMKEYYKGYLLFERLLRPAKVVVAKSEDKTEVEANRKI